MSRNDYDVFVLATGRDTGHRHGSESSITAEYSDVVATKGNGRIGNLAAVFGFGALAIAVVGLAGRLLAYPLNRDENMFVTAASQLGSGDLYRDLGYNHLPNLAYLLGAVYSLTGTGHFLLVGRLVIIASWIAALFVLWLIVRRLRLGIEVFFAAAFLLVGNVLLLGASGMLVSNNFMPIPGIFLAFYFLLRALDEDGPALGSAFLAGALVSLTIGLKANYIMLAPFFAIATLFAPRGATLGERILRGFLPLAVGGVVGGLPALVHIALDPEGFFAHTLRYFTELQPAYWRDVEAPKTVSVAEKVLLAEEVWMSSAVLLAIATSAVLFIAAIRQSGLRVMLDWRLLMLFGLLACSMVVSFVPTPSFPQYFVPPVPFLVLLVIVLAGKVRRDDEGIMLSLFVAVAVLGFVSGASRFAQGALAFRDPGDWVTFAMNREVRKVGALAGLAPGARVATFTPVLALEGGYAIYPEFAAGQFVYRVAPYIPEADRPLYRTTSPKELAAFLDRNRPAGILVNRGEPMEEALANYARARGFKVRSEPGVGDGFDLYVASE